MHVNDLLRVEKAKVGNLTWGMWSYVHSIFVCHRHDRLLSGSLASLMSHVSH